ncbi:MAG: hypothetical protein ING36_05230 [Burkholderiales bacterium]|nr:hypothetical protein [Burkholderiales bacterium]
MKSSLVVGDSLNFVTQVPDYLATEGWTLKYRLIPRSAGASIEISAVAEGESYRVQVAAMTTATWSAGEYSWASWVEKSGESYSLESGAITLAPNPRTATGGYDARSLAQKTLDDLRAAFAAWSASSGRTKRYKIGEREMEFNSVTDIIKLMDYWEGQVTQEQLSADLARGLKPKNRILVRFGRPS